MYIIYHIHDYCYISIGSIKHRIPVEVFRLDFGELVAATLRLQPAGLQLSVELLEVHAVPRALVLLAGFHLPHEVQKEEVLLALPWDASGAQEISPLLLDPLEDALELLIFLLHTDARLLAKVVRPL